MKKYISIIPLVVILVAGLVFAQKKNQLPIETRWKTVEQLAGKQLPESALKEVETILTQAQKENNLPEIIKAYIYKIRFTLEKDPDKATKLIREFETFAQKNADPAYRALLHSMTAELYANFYHNDSWTINNRTEVVGFVPEDMNEWTKNIYFDKITKLLSASLENAVLLQNTDTLKFAALLEKGEDSRKLQPTLFDFLAYRKIDVLNGISHATVLNNPLSSDIYFAEASEFAVIELDTAYENSVENKILETYQQLIDFHSKGENAEALIYADLNRLQYLKNATNNSELYLKALKSLEEKHAENEFVVEVLAEKANYYLQNSYEDEVNKNSKRTAYEICVDGIKRFPKYKRINLLENIKLQITQKNLNVSHNEVLKSLSNLEIKINSANIPVLQLQVYSVNATAMEYLNFRQNRKTRHAIFPKRTLLESRELSIKADPNFGTVDSTFILKSRDYGIYEICVNESGNAEKDKVSNTVFVVSDFGYIQRTNVANLQSLYVLDRQTGLQQAGVQIAVFEPKWTGNGYEYELKSSSKSDKNGLCNIPFANNYHENKVFLEQGNDKYFSSATYAHYYNSVPSNFETPHLNIFTDRSIYRPGQIVYFKGIAYFTNKNRQEVIRNSNYEVTLYDANNQKVGAKSFKTNDFGSFAGEFVLPEGGLNGAYRLKSGKIAQTIFVEEYKRPTFEVTIEKPKTEIRFGEKVTITGSVKAYAGYNVGNSNVKYRVVRRTHRFCWWWHEPETEITNGTTITDANGKFEVSFVPEKSKNSTNSWRGNFYTYTILADVTDPKGETQQGEQSLSVGDKSLFIIAVLPNKIDKNTSVKIDIYTETLNGEKVNSVIDYEVFRVDDSSDYIENQNKEFEPKTIEKVLSGKFNTSDKNLLLETKKWKSAQYKLVLKTTDAFGIEVKTENTFVLYGNNDKRPPVKTYVWLLTPKTSCIVGEKAEIRFGTSTKNTSVLYEIMQGNKILESKWIKLNDEIKVFEVAFKEEYGAGVTVLFTFMKDEKFFTKSVQVTRKTEEKKLKPTLSVFRDKLLPGEKAEWTITIPEVEKNNKAAELLVGMYDASLDVIRPHNWNPNLIYREGVLISPVWSANNFNKSSGSVSFGYIAKNTGNYKFDNLNWFGLIIGSSRTDGRPVMMRGAKSFAVADNIVLESVKINEELQSVMAGISVSEDDSDKSLSFQGVETVDGKKQPPVQIRTNFNETAFFYPQLRTDAKGNVKFSFTVPESLTRWNVKMLAHTQDLFFGQNEAQVVTQKDLMVQMNLPRFVRRSDKMVLGANVINLTDKAMVADVTFEMIDPATEKSIILKDSDAIQISLAANETKPVEWEVTEFSGFELVICKVVAQSGSFSDGEQKYLPVLPDKILVTESLPLTIRANQTRTFSFENLLKNATKVETQNLAVEFSSNPAWYAVQALPTLSAPVNNNALDYFTAYYANSLAAFIANANPKIAKIFDQWKNTKGSREALLSNLQKNPELKNMLLEETPWVLAAKDETEQKRQIALLFDLNMQKNQSQQYLDKLLKLQSPNGGFAWFDGMPESRYITQEIMLNMARLNRMTDNSVTGNQQLAIKAALNYLDLQISKDFAELKKNNKNYQKVNSIGNMQLFYLHVRSEYPEIPIHVSAQEAVKFYTNQSEKYWTSFTLYGKAMMAVVANRNGKVKVASDILKSLKENALKTDELGMYWARNSAGYFWNERPIAVQAAIIEAFAEVSKNTADVDEMKIWLLRQKQTQRWDSPMATVNAIYALLLQGSDWLANEGSVKIEVGNKMLQPKVTEAGTGYFKETIPADEVRAEMGKVTVSSEANNKSSIGWGAMYWQYYQDLEKVEGQGGALKISKKLFVQKITPTGKTMLPIEQAKLTKGDKVITRLTITTDRNLEFVALKDLRASCFEPVNQLSGSMWKENVCYYQTTKDASTQFFFSYLPKGTYVFEYELWVNNSGEFTSGIGSIQCLYAPEFVSHTGGERIVVQ
jgi:uncharacterized protein YfaS (alpha-2-macroglobulin family)